MQLYLYIKLHIVCFNHSFAGQSIENSSRVYQIGPNLHINGLNRSLDNGDYKCIATSVESGARETSPITTLDVQCK